MVIVTVFHYIPQKISHPWLHLWITTESSTWEKSRLDMSQKNDVRSFYVEQTSDEWNVFCFFFFFFFTCLSEHWVTALSFIKNRAWFILGGRFLVFNTNYNVIQPEETRATVTNMHKWSWWKKSINKPLPDFVVALPTSETGQRRRVQFIRWRRERKTKKNEIWIRNHQLQDSTFM